MKSPILYFLFLFATLCPAPRVLSDPLPLGSLTLGSPGAPPSGCPSGMTCYAFTTTIPSVVPTHCGDGHLAVMQPSGTPIGLIMFYPGAGGKFWEQANPTLVDPFYQQLSALGYILVDVQWGSNAWYSSASGEQAGAPLLACRPATVMKWVHDNWFAGGKFEVTGSSAGSMAIGLSLTMYGLDSIVDVLVPDSGPVNANLAANCTTNATNSCGNDPICGAGSHVMDDSYGFYGNNNGPCAVHDSSFVPTWNRDSIELGGINYTWPTTTVHILEGSLDQTGIRSDGLAFQNALTSAGTNADYQLVSGMGHGAANTQQGLSALLTALTPQSAPAPTPTATATATATNTPTPTPTCTCP